MIVILIGIMMKNYYVFRDDNIIQFWEMANYVYFKDNEDETINI